MRLYDIASDMLAAEKLIEESRERVDENGEPVGLSEEDMNYINECFTCSAEQFEHKFDGYCKFIKNYRIEAQNIDAERKNYKAEMDRLSKRSKTAENIADRLQDMLQMNMERLGMQKWKTELFSAGIQATQLSIKPREGSNLSGIPDCYLKPRELDTAAIKADIKAGKLKVIEDGIDYGSVCTADGTKLNGVFARKGKTLVIR